MVKNINAVHICYLLVRHRFLLIVRNVVSKMFSKSQELKYLIHQIYIGQSLDSLLESDIVK